jgi:phosphoribosylanthranilate isomerase
VTRVKVCGLTREADLAAAVAAGTDAVGFVVDVPVDTPREVTAERAAALVAQVPPFVTSVLVTMPEDTERTRDLARTVGADVLQVHAASPEQVAALAETERVVTATTSGEATRYADVADALLVDSADESGAGGTGETHDWAATRALVDSLDVPVVLAGGLTPENVAEAVRAVRPFAVDVASGVEASGGVKDHDAVRAFVRRATREVLEA